MHMYMICMYICVCMYTWICTQQSLCPLSCDKVQVKHYFHLYIRLSLELNSSSWCLIKFSLLYSHRFERFLGVSVRYLCYLKETMLIEKLKNFFKLVIFSRKIFLAHNFLLLLLLSLLLNSSTQCPACPQFRCLSIPSIDMSPCCSCAVCLALLYLDGSLSFAGESSLYLSLELLRKLNLMLILKLYYSFCI